MKTLKDLYKKHQGKKSYKWDFYFEEYDRIFSHCKYDRVKLLEIGVQNGGSLEIWSQYFENATAIVGCDIDAKCGYLAFEDPRISVLVGDINNSETIQALESISPTFDIVLDDGSHHSSDIIRSFFEFFPRVSAGGLYLIEDLHCSYWAEYGGGLYHPQSAISFLKKLVDILNRDYWGKEISISDFLDDFEATLSPKLDESNYLSLRSIQSIEFSNSICVIRKKSLSYSSSGNLVEGGKHSKKDVETSAHKSNLKLITPDQNGNHWSSLDMLNDSIKEKLSIANNEIANLKRKNMKLTSEVYQSTKQFYEASKKIQELELELEMSKQTKSKFRFWKK